MKQQLEPDMEKQTGSKLGKEYVKAVYRSEEQNKLKRTEDSCRDLWENINTTNIRIIRVPEEEEKKKRYQKIFDKIIVENFPNMEKEINSLMLLLLLSRFSRGRLCVTPRTEAHQAPPSLGFSRQEHWSGLPFPSPMHESEK